MVVGRHYGQPLEFYFSMAQSALSQLATIGSCFSAFLSGLQLDVFHNRKERLYYSCEMFSHIIPCTSGFTESHYTRSSCQANREPDVLYCLM